MPEGTPAMLTISVDEVGRPGAAVHALRATGDVTNARQLRDRLRAELTDAARDDERILLVDLRGVSFLGASGVTALIEAGRDAPAGLPPIRLVVDGNRPVVRAAEITGLEQVFAVYEDVDDALAGRPKQLDHRRGPGRPVEADDREPRTAGG